MASPSRVRPVRSADSRRASSCRTSYTGRLDSVDAGVLVLVDELDTDAAGECHLEVVERLGGHQALQDERGLRCAAEHHEATFGVAAGRADDRLAAGEPAEAWP